MYEHIKDLGRHRLYRIDSVFPRLLAQNLLSLTLETLLGRVHCPHFCPWERPRRPHLWTLSSVLTGTHAHRLVQVTWKGPVWRWVRGPHTDQESWAGELSREYRGERVSGGMGAKESSRADRGFWMPGPCL